MQIVRYGYKNGTGINVIAGKFQLRITNKQFACWWGYAPIWNCLA